MVFGSGPQSLWQTLSAATSSRFLFPTRIARHDNRGWPGDEVVSDLARAGLPVASVIRTVKIATIEAADATKLGRLSAATLRQVGKHMERNVVSSAVECSLKVHDETRELALGDKVMILSWRAEDDVRLQVLRVSRRSDTTATIGVGSTPVMPRTACYYC
jgi:hypothetical protein